MKRVLTAVVLIPLVLLVVFRAPLWLFALVVGVIIVLSLHEYLNIAKTAGMKPFERPTYALAVLPIILLWISEGEDLLSRVGVRYAAYPPGGRFLFGLWAIVFLSPIVFGIPLVFRKDLKEGLVSSAVSSFGVVYIGASLSLLIIFRADPWQNILIIFILLSVWIGDTAAYYVGKNFGRHKLAPIVSPGKTWEGAIASVVASVAVAFLVFHFYAPIVKLFRGGHWLFFYPSIELRVPLIHVMTLGILTNVAAQFGDLFESALKRGANLKDSGTLLPGHGGMLDRIDALLFAVPVAWYYANLTGFLYGKSFL